MKTFVMVCAGLSFVAALLAVFFLQVPVALVATWGMAALCLVWLLAVVTLPWNLHLEARHVLAEMKRSTERGIVVPAERVAEAERVRRRTLAVSVGLHVASAIGMSAVAFLTGEVIAWWFAGFYLLSTGARPAIEYHRHVRERLSTLLAEARYPRDDVVSLVGDVQELKRRVQEHELEYRELFTSMQRVEKEGMVRDVETERKVVALARKFDETLDRLTDNQEIISGVKAFLRLIQQGTPH